MGLAAGFGHYLRGAVADGVHSGSGRTALNDDHTDSYPVPLSQDALRPGTVYADPYGHLLVLAKRVSQTEDAAGVFLAVDGQPDGTVARKRFWRGNFLFAQDPALGGPGFKRFRPIVRDKNGTLRRLTNAEIASNTEYGDFSLEQGKVSVEEFYDRMRRILRVGTVAQQITRERVNVVEMRQGQLAKATGFFGIAAACAAHHELGGLGGSCRPALSSTFQGLHRRGKQSSKHGCDGEPFCGC